MWYALAVGSYPDLGVSTRFPARCAERSRSPLPQLQRQSPPSVGAAEKKAEDEDEGTTTNRGGVGVEKGYVSETCAGAHVPARGSDVSERSAPRRTSYAHACGYAGLPSFAAGLPSQATQCSSGMSRPCAASSRRLRIILLLSLRHRYSALDPRSGLMAAENSGTGLRPDHAMRAPAIPGPSLHVNLQPRLARYQRQHCHASGIGGRGGATASNPTRRNRAALVRLCVA
jgi:hypothetical protein